MRSSRFMGRFTWVLLVCSAVALAQPAVGPSEPRPTVLVPLPEGPEPVPALAPATPVESSAPIAQPSPPVEAREPSVWDNCFRSANTQAVVMWQPGVRVGGAVRAGEHPASSASGGPGSSGSRSRSGSGGSAGSWLVALVVVAAALPVVVYVIDADANAAALGRFYCPEASFTGIGGVEGATQLGHWNGIASGRFQSSWGFVGADFQFDIAPLSVSAFSSHFIGRFVPKQHIDLGIALGWRRAVYGGVVRDGFEIVIPHQYILSREAHIPLGLELRPSFFIDSLGPEVALEAMINVPFANYFGLRVGGRVQSFRGLTFVTAAGGLSVGY